jgi:UDP-glucose 4-epimerase
MGKTQVGESIVVTGSNGFIGARLVEKLTNLGANVVRIDAAGTNGSNPVDIRSPEVADLIPPSSRVVHLAALSTSGSCKTDPALAASVNIVGTLNLAQAARAAGALQFVFASTEWVYGSSGSEEPTFEDLPIDIAALTDTYAITKIAAEGLLKSSGLFDDLMILRFGIVYGPRSDNWSAVESLLNSSSKGRVEVGSLATARRFIFVDDVVDGILSSLGHRGQETLNLAGSRLVTLGDVITESEKILGHGVSVDETNPTAVSVRNPNPRRAMDVLGWRPEVDLHEGLSRVAAHLGIGH